VEVKQCKSTDDVNWTCRCQWERIHRWECRSCEQLQCLELRRRTWLVLQCHVGW